MGPAVALGGEPVKPLTKRIKREIALKIVLVTLRIVEVGGRMILPRNNELQKARAVLPLKTQRSVVICSRIPHWRDFESSLHELEKRFPRELDAIVRWANRSEFVSFLRLQKLPNLLLYAAEPGEGSGGLRHD
jgi:hypothetical protein